VFAHIIRGSLAQPWLVLGLALALLVGGSYLTATMPVDVLPELAAPSVTVVTEAGGLAPEEVERAITIPLEQALNGAQGVRRVRSSSAIGISLVWVDFDWDVEPRTARQIVTERLATAVGSLPSGVEPFMAPASSIMGEVMFVGLTGEGIDPAELRTTAEWDVRRRLMSVPGIAQVVPIGGDVAQVEIVLLPDRLMQHGVASAAVIEALEGASESRSGGFVVTGPQEYLVRAIGRPGSLEELAAIAVARRDDVPIRLGDLAEVRFGAAIRRGAAAVDGVPAVVLKVQKQPLANTLAVTDAVDEALDEVARGLPAGMELYRKGFRQADFIRVAIDNVTLHLLQAAGLVALVLVIFLMSWRTTVISLVALPLSLLAGLVVLRLMDASINTMTLGGLAIAIGELVDDAIIDVENVHRRLRENASRPPDGRRPVLTVVRDASQEIRSSIVFATVIIVLVFLPLFFLSGLEGRLLWPLGLAFVTSISASLLVALTVTPVLCLFLLGSGDVARHVEKARLARWLEERYRRVVRVLLRVPRLVAGLSLGGAVAAVVALLGFGRAFLPTFNEGSLNIAAATAPGTSLETSEAIVGRLERYLREHPSVTSVIRTTGRAERDEHALDVNFSELEVGLSIERGQREQIFAEVRERASAIPGLAVSVGQPISHRIEHMVSGSRASIVVKIFGPDLDRLRTMARAAESAMGGIEGVVDLTVEQQTEIPLIAIVPRSTELSAFGATPGALAQFVEMSLAGHEVGTHWRADRPLDVVVRFPHAYRHDHSLLLQLPVDRDGQRYARLDQLARIDKTMGPNLINRENGERRIYVTANVAGRDLRSVATDVEAAVRRAIVLPPRYHVALGGEFEQQASASRTILALAIAAVVTIAFLLVVAFRSARDATLVMVNLPLALVGGVIAVWLGGGVLSVASLVGFVTLFGIATRNGIMMVSHYRRMIHEEGASLEEAIVEGSVHRLLPILMTALTAALALVPIALAASEPGGEIQGPMAAVILGGLTSSTLLNLLVLPSLYARFSSASPARPRQRQARGGA
jgi:copper/silver efflux system protein